ICFMEKLGWRDRRISPDAGSLFQTFPNRSDMVFPCLNNVRVGNCTIAIKVESLQETNDVTYSINGVGVLLVIYLFTKCRTWQPALEHLIFLAFHVLHASQR
ncbi:hypothetical protein, partial [Pseudomonas monteilii]|uniref:hypothetical protein n=1 Tax=Pseudomonas monteilii TaxID=76759 RepID=UPI001E30A428